MYVYGTYTSHMNTSILSCFQPRVVHPLGAPLVPSPSLIGGRPTPVHCTKSNCQVRSTTGGTFASAPPLVPFSPSPPLFPLFPRPTEPVSALTHLVLPLVVAFEGGTSLCSPNSSRPSMPQEGSAPPPKLEDRFVLSSQEITRGELTTRFDRRLIHLLNICP